jgi:hypothetical protein
VDINHAALLCLKLPPKHFLSPMYHLPAPRLSEIDRCTAPILCSLSATHNAAIGGFPVSNRLINKQLSLGIAVA